MDLNVSLDDLFSGTIKKLKITRKRFSGASAIRDEKILDIEIKKGWKDGTKLTFSGDGDQETPNGPPGDLLFTLKTKPHPTFSREGNNLVTRISVSLTKALCGFTATVPRIDGRSTSVTIDEVVGPKTRKVMPGEGMPLSKRPTERGDLIVEFDISFPRKLTMNQKRSLKEILGEQ